MIHIDRKLYIKLDNNQGMSPDNTLCSIYVMLPYLPIIAPVAKKVQKMQIVYF